MDTNRTGAKDSRSVWRGTAQAATCPVLEGDVACDVVIVGGGITGVTLAVRLADEGRSVVLLEAREIGVGSTGNSTGNLYATVSEGLRGIVDTWGAKIATDIVRSRQEAVDWVEQRVRQSGIDCGFRRCPLYWSATDATAQESVEKEHRAAQELKLACRIERTLPSPLPPAHGEVLVLEQQAQFHPLAYTRALAAQAAAQGCRIFERSAAIDIDRDKRVIHTARGSVAAKHVVLATHSPSGFHLVQAGMLPSQEYGLAIRGAGLPPGVYWSKGTDRLSTRGLEVDGASFVICVGEPHTTGQHAAGAAMQQLEALARRRFGAGDIAFRWSAQNFRSPDGLPYIGLDAADAHIATGFGTDGLVYGTLAASLIADRIAGRDNRWSELYRASRFAPIKGAKGAFEEVASMTRALVEDYLTPQQRQTLADLAPGSGRIVDVDKDSLAAYRDDDGTLFVVSSVCTHLRCKVRWNDMQRSWDCPCHGSRFAPSGEVLEGPAIKPLRRKVP